MKERFRRRKNFLPAFLVAVILWAAWLLVFFYVLPEDFLLRLFFLALTFCAITLSGALIFANTRRGALLALGVIGFMLLNYYGIGNFLNLILLAGILLAAEYYFSR